MTPSELDFEYSERNHYRWGWGESADWFNKPRSGQRFKVSFGRPSRAPKSFREECVFAAGKIAAEARGRIFVGLSGGSDSQAVCLALRECGVDFTPCIVMMKNGVNLHDVSGAFQFCYRFNLSPRIFILDLEEFYSGAAVQYARRYSFSNSRTMIQLWLQQQVGLENTFIMGGGDPQFTRYRSAEKEVGPLSWEFKPTPILQYLVQNRLAGTTKFFMYSPELIASIVMHPFVRAFAESQDAIFAPAFLKPKHHWKIYNYTIKPMIYKENWPEIICRPKFTGFEVAEARAHTSALAEAAVADARAFNAGKGIKIPLTELQAYFSTQSVARATVWYSAPSLPAAEGPASAVVDDSGGSYLAGGVSGGARVDIGEGVAAAFIHATTLSN
ncbi:MAG: hypothetical protein JWR21_1119 [Herminiimonas sp.]|nr:hypothetical protein [Herminiimonas sp.]